MFKEYLEEDGKNAIDGRPAGIINLKKCLKNMVEEDGRPLIK
jgi:hypothetical protein